MDSFVAARGHGGGTIAIFAVDTDSEGGNKEQWLGEHTDGVLLVSPRGDPMGKPFAFPRLKHDKATKGAYQFPPMVQAATLMSNAKQGARGQGTEFDVGPFLHADWAGQDVFKTAHITHDDVKGSKQLAMDAAVKGTTTLMSRLAGSTEIDVPATDGTVTGTATVFQQRTRFDTHRRGEGKTRHYINNPIDIMEYP